MKNIYAISCVLLLLSGCGTELSFVTRHFASKTTLPCDERCAEVTLDIVIAKDGGAVSDSINRKVFSALREIIYFGEKPYTAGNYADLLSSFIASYDQMKTEYPDDIFGWNGKISGKVKYQSDNIINIEIDHYTFTGGAHGYSGLRSLIFDIETGKVLSNDNLFKDVNAFEKVAEREFRSQFKIPAGEAINSGGLMFENEEFSLPQNIFFTSDGLLLHYNAYEIASYAEGPQQLLIPFELLENQLMFR